MLKISVATFFKIWTNDGGASRQRDFPPSPLTEPYLWSLVIRHLLYKLIHFNFLILSANGKIKLENHFLHHLKYSMQRTLFTDSSLLAHDE